MQQVALCCVCVIGCAACGTVWSRFGVLSVQQVAFWCVCVCDWVCCVWNSLEQVWGIECVAGCFVLCECVCVLRVGQLVAGLGD